MRRTMPAAECIATDAEVIDDEQNLRQEQAWWYPVIDAFWMNRQCRCASVQRDTTWREIAGRSRPVDGYRISFKWCRRTPETALSLRAD